MPSPVPLYKYRALLLSQSFFIKDNAAELRLHAHKYDFDMAFFSEVSQFVAAVEGDTGNGLFVIDLDALHNMQSDMLDSRKTLMLGELLQRLPAGKEYVYLQSSRQGGRYLLQQKLVDCHCLAYAEKPIANDVLVDKLFKLFVQQKRGDLVRLMHLGDMSGMDEACLHKARIELIEHDQAQTLHLRVRELQPDLVLVSDAEFARTESLAWVLKKNIEADPVREIVLLQRQPDAALMQRALANGFDAVLPAGDAELLCAQLINRASKIRVSKDLISKDRATGLLNKVGLQQKAQELIRQAAREERPLAYGVIDIDKFKTINDTWGHYFGDIVLKRLAVCLASHLGERDLLSRFGGEEFVVVFWDCTVEEGWARLDAMRRAFGALPFEVRAGDVRRFSFSGGMAAYPACQTENALFLRADAMLYEAKQGGRDRICPPPVAQAAA
ncbi:Response regulator PleD [Massilia sp. Bi118]|uniref:GGDEF domain-containing protein n=1 Tax=Massilia sp. Bi118 TaxID=2822346 RepID=UPI001DB121D6|nr:GGDEF domain-containing protein [Massilia sp. Bi118]CAH0301482.1 Response regulator PleD [Massilia sp. Bi118]